MTTFLPSLVYVLDLNSIINKNKIEDEHYQDELTRKISSNNKNNFGNIVFGEDLNIENNKLVDVGCF